MSWMYFVEREIILFGLTNDLFICRWDDLKIGADPKWVGLSCAVSLLSCAREFFLIGYVFWGGWMFQEKDFPDWGVPNVGKCSTCQMFAFSSGQRWPEGEVCQTMFLLNSVEKKKEPCSNLLMPSHFLASKQAVSLWTSSQGCELLSFFPKATLLAKFFEFF